MIFGAHLLLYSPNPEVDRNFLRDVLKFPAVDAGEGWLIFSMPPAEAGIHPIEGALSKDAGEQTLLGAVLYLMCDDLDATITSLKTKNVECTEVQAAGWGRVTTILLPSGGKIGLYQPRHATALSLK